MSKKNSAFVREIFGEWFCLEISQNTGLNSLEQNSRQREASRSCSWTFFVVVFSFCSPSIYWKIKHRKRTSTFLQNLLFNSFPIKSYFWTSCVYQRKSTHPFTNKEANNRLNCLELSSDWFSYTSVFYRKTEKLSFEVPLSKSNSQTFLHRLSFDSAPFRFYRTNDSKTHNHLAQFVS